MSFRMRGPCGFPRSSLKSEGSIRSKSFAKTDYSKVVVYKNKDTLIGVVASDTCSGVLEPFRQRSVIFFKNETSWSQRDMKRDLKVFEQGIKTTNKNHPVMWQPASALMSKVFVKKEYVFVEELVGNGIELSFSAQEMYKML